MPVWRTGHAGVERSDKVWLERDVKVTVQKHAGITMYTDLMGPFEPDLLNNIYEMPVMESKYGWIEVKGIPNKSSDETTEKFKSMVSDILSNSIKPARGGGGASDDR